MSGPTHWNEVYGGRPAEERSWFQARPDLSLELIRSVAPPPGPRILDVGGGASGLAGHLLEAGYHHPTVLDLSGTALSEARSALGPRAEDVRWIEADVLAGPAGWGDHTGPWDVWHDRAVFHFLVDRADQALYAAVLRSVVPVGGHAIIGTFAADGPSRCSGLPTLRCHPEQIASRLGAGLRLTDARREEHRTPSGSVQAFSWAVLERVEVAGGG